MPTITPDGNKANKLNHEPRVSGPTPPPQPYNTAIFRNIPPLTFPILPPPPSPPHPTSRVVSNPPPNPPDKCIVVPDPNADPSTLDPELMGPIKTTERCRNGARCTYAGYFGGCKFDHGPLCRNGANCTFDGFFGGCKVRTSSS